MIRRQDLGDGVRALVWDNPEGPLNINRQAVNAAFAAEVEAALADANIKAVVVTSAKADFIVGGDLDEIRRVGTPAEAAGLVRPIKAAFRRMETGGKLFVAAINGSALGGGLELALACHRRIAARNLKARLGLPEMGLGLIPGAGGTQRLPRLVGVEQAARMILQAVRLSVEEGLQLGLIDEVVEAEQLMSAAKAFALSGVEPLQSWDRKGFTLPGLHPQSPAGRRFFQDSWARLTAKSSPPDPAAEAVVQVLHHGLERTIDAGLAIEEQHFARIVSGQAAKNKIRTLFYGVNAARSMRARPAGLKPRSIGRVGVLGAGLMGSGIAYVSAAAGLEVTLLDVSEEFAAKGKDSVARIADRMIKRGSLDPAGREALLARIYPTTDYARLAQASLMIEAVSEVLAIKQDVIRKASAAGREEAVIASNTSTLPIASLAGAARNAANVLGLHFFAPVERMELVEVIHSTATSDAALAHTFDYVKCIRKVPILVRDGLGFFTSRVVSAYSAEALTLMAEGISPALVDNVAQSAGMPIGPLAMADATSLTLLSDIMHSMQGDRTRPVNRGNRAEEALHTLVAVHGRKGKPSGGIFDYPPEGRCVWPGLRDVFPRDDKPLSAETVRRRLFHTQALEAVRAMEEGIIQSATDADVASVLGWAFPAVYGGVMSYIDTIGVKVFVQQCSELAAAFGGRFEPPASLRELAKSGGSVHASMGGLAKTAEAPSSL